MTEREAMTAALRAYWLGALAQTNGNASAAARLAGVSRHTVYDRKKRLSLPSRAVHRGNWASVD